MRGKVSRWGNSLAVRIPKAIADEAGVDVDDAIEIHVRDSKIFLEPANRRQRGDLTLDELLDQIPEGSEDEELDWGPPVGKEIW
jgi:antitoxin MazE